jgi:hypothetical protein
LPAAHDGPWLRVPASACPRACGNATVARPPPATLRRCCRPISATCRPRAPCSPSPYALPCRAVAHLSTHSHAFVRLCSLQSLLLTCHKPRLAVEKLRLNSDHLPNPSSTSNDRWSVPPLPVSHPPLLPRAPQCGQPPLSLLQPSHHLLEDRVILLMLPGPEVSRSTTTPSYRRRSPPTETHLH